MPVILPTQEAIATWLGLGAEPKSDAQVKEGMNVDDSWSTEVAKLLRPLQAALECYKVPKEGWQGRHSDPSFLLPVEERRDGLKAFFAKQKAGKNLTLTRQVRRQRRAESSKRTSGSDVSAQARQKSRHGFARYRGDHGDRAKRRKKRHSSRRLLERNRKKQTARLAEQMQRELENDSSSHESVVDAGESLRASSRATSVVVIDDDDSVEADEVGDGFGVPEHVPRDDSASDRASKRTRVEPSSRFSPDPLQPTRLATTTTRGIQPQAIACKWRRHPRHAARAERRDHVHMNRFPQAPPHTWSSPKKERERGDIGDMLKQQAAKQPRSPSKANDATSRWRGEEKGCGQRR
ncbi:hypothetical protein L1887_61149 [Cichorium endivia]|nr:hypothetical protein L1887_61149 [Cichorium endivia]